MRSIVTSILVLSVVTTAQAQTVGVVPPNSGGVAPSQTGQVGVIPPRQSQTIYRHQRPHKVSHRHHHHQRQRAPRMIPIKGLPAIAGPALLGPTQPNFSLLGNRSLAPNRLPYLASPMPTVPTMQIGRGLMMPKLSTLFAPKVLPLQSPLFGAGLRPYQPPVPMFAPYPVRRSRSNSFLSQLLTQFLPMLGSLFNGSGFGLQPGFSPLFSDTSNLVSNVNPATVPQFTNTAPAPTPAPLFQNPVETPVEDSVTSQSVAREISAPSSIGQPEPLFSNVTADSTGGSDAFKTQPEVASPNGLDISALTYQTALSVGKDDIGLNRGFSLNQPVGWAQITPECNIAGVSGLRSHCTSATHATFLKTVCELVKRGAIELTPQARAALNSPLFRHTWNANGHSVNWLYQKLGGESFTDPSAARPGDLVKLDTTKNGHVGFVKKVTPTQICFWSSNQSTNGPGEICRDRSQYKSMVFSRITDLSKLQEGLNNLFTTLNKDQVLASVRAHQGGGTVPRSAVSSTSARVLSPPAPVAGATSAPRSGRTRFTAQPSTGTPAVAR